LQIDTLGSVNSEFAFSIDFIPAKHYSCNFRYLLGRLTLLWHSFRRHALGRHILLRHTLLGHVLWLIGATHGTTLIWAALVTALTIHAAPTEAASLAPHESLTLATAESSALSALTITRKALALPTPESLALATHGLSALSLSTGTSTLSALGFSGFSALFHELTHL
jgi:hypothetical protein